MVTIEELDPATGGGWRCRVLIEQEGIRTAHHIGVTAGDVERWAAGHGRADVEDLVHRSVEFLLEREPAASILRSFDLAVIPQYFPEYDRLFRRSD